MDAIDLDLSCSGCGQESDQIAALRSGDEVVAIMCRKCLLEAVSLIDQAGQNQNRKDNAN